MNIQPSTDLQKKKQDFNTALFIDNYFKLIEFCEKNNTNIYDNSRFWYRKLGKDFHSNSVMLNGEYKAKYQSLLSQQLWALSNISGRYDNDNVYTISIYGNDVDDLRDKAIYLRKESNKAFPMEYDKRLYEIYVRDDPEENEPSYREILDEIKRQNITTKQGQLFLVKNLNRIPRLYVYIYQLGPIIETEIIKYPNLPEILFEDTSRSKIKELYGINIEGEKL